MCRPRRTREKAAMMLRPLRSNCRTKAAMTSSCLPRKAPTRAPSSAPLFSNRKWATSPASPALERAAHQASGSRLKALAWPRTSVQRRRRSAHVAAQWLLEALARAAAGLALAGAPVLATASAMPTDRARATPTSTSTAAGRRLSLEAAQARASSAGSMTVGSPRSQSCSAKISQTRRGLPSSHPRHPTAHSRVCLHTAGFRTSPQSSAATAGK
mmetsp:Transcript_104389/g.336596  ORF Transcript_104389/g.336596 Transcript_104389/m.336596 type:complete len:214 (-) Transcript_104389:125-766(-)